MIRQKLLRRSVNSSRRFRRQDDRNKAFVKITAHELPMPTVHKCAGNFNTNVNSLILLTLLSHQTWRRSIQPDLQIRGRRRCLCPQRACLLGTHAYHPTTQTTLEIEGKEAQNRRQRCPPCYAQRPWTSKARGKKRSEPTKRRQGCPRPPESSSKEGQRPLPPGSGQRQSKPKRPKEAPDTCHRPKRPHRPEQAST